MRGLASGWQGTGAPASQELGVTSKEILARLNADGELAKSASATVEAPAARRLRESFSATPSGQKAPADEAERQHPSAAQVRPEAEARRPKQRKAPVGRADAALSRRNRQPGSTASNQRAARPGLRRRVRKEQATRSAPKRAGRQPPEMPPSPVIVHRPRARRSGLPQVAVNLDVEAVADIVAGDPANDDTEAIATCLHEIAPYWARRIRLSHMAIRRNPRYGQRIKRQHRARGSRRPSSLHRPREAIAQGFGASPRLHPDETEPCWTGIAERV